jgi:conjugal transfer pilus assembly protein TraW
MRGEDRLTNTWILWRFGYLVTLMSLSVLFQVARAHEVDARGKCFLIKEEDFQHFIVRQLHDKNIQKQIQADFENRVRKNIKRPMPVSTVTRAKENRTYFINPTKQIILNGKLFKENPFDTVHFDKTLVFINGDDAKQQRWLQSFLKISDQKTLLKIILVGGDVEEVSQMIKWRVYFDQQGKLTDYFKLKHVPVVVTENTFKKQWQVQEINVNEGESS